MRSLTLLLALLPAWQTHAIDASIRLVQGQVGAPVAVAVAYAGVPAYRNRKASQTYPLGSLTKSFTAAAVLQLAGRGRFRLSDPIGAYLPNVASSRAPSIATVLAQTAPWEDYSETPGFDPQCAYAPTQLLALVPPPGSGDPPTFVYSNSNYIALGLLVEATGGMPYARFVRERIAAPLGLPSLRYAGPSSLFSAGALWATPIDVTTWLEALLSNRLHVRPDLARLFFQTGYDGAHRPTGYGMGAFVGRTRGRLAYFAAGFTPRGSTYMMALPDSHVEIALATTAVAFDLAPLALDLVDTLEPPVTTLLRTGEVESSTLQERTPGSDGSLDLRYTVKVGGRTKYVFARYDRNGKQAVLSITDER